ncbi:MAG TPA: phosphatidylserine decarboxylase [Desulfomonilaceae bacterium]|nr:phosphatidylserine decarboxylase [Desulfomonilaceae bacterium]
MTLIRHQYVERETGEARTELLRSDRAVNVLYSFAIEKAPTMFRALTSARMSRLLGLVSYDLPIGPSGKRFLRECGIDFSECVEPPEHLDTRRKVFERQIRYWEYRPMPDNPNAIVSPADSRVILGSLGETSLLFIKDKFFDLDELLGIDKPHFISAFQEGDFAIFRLTPDKYHYNHTPVSGTVLDIYEIPGRYHSCNPGAVVHVVTPCSKNKRVVTIIDTDVENGTGVGLVAMIEIVALMIGDIVQAYSETNYENPCSVAQGMFLKKGVPKSLYRPGSSTDLLLFQKGRIVFAEDLITNMRRSDVQSRFSIGFDTPLAETDLKVRSLIATAVRQQ